MFWAYTGIPAAPARLIGSLYRDTWVRTANGWQRIRQEKFFPDRPLMENGKPVILPPPD
jgi:hypothetical protein